MPFYQGKSYGFKELLVKLLEQKDIPKEYNVVTLDLGTARTDVALGLSGRKIRVVEATSGASVDVKFNTTTNDVVPLQSVNSQIELDIQEVYVTNASALGESITLLVLK